MDWIAAIWNKINKPLHFLFVGTAIVLFAPVKINWAGYIFVAAGLASSIEWISPQILKWWTGRINVEKLRQAVATLNTDEKAVLLPLIQKDERTFYMDPFRSGSIPNHLRLMSLYFGLSDKGILNITPVDGEGKIMTLHITDAAWKILKQNLNVSAHLNDQKKAV